MYQAIAEDQSATLGGIYLLIFFGVPIVLVAWLSKRYGPAMLRKKRKRQIETAVLMHSVDAELFGEVLDDLYTRRARRR